MGPTRLLIPGSSIQICLYYTNILKWQFYLVGSGEFSVSIDQEVAYYYKQIIAAFLAYNTIKLDRSAFYAIDASDRTARTSSICIFFYAMGSP